MSKKTECHHGLAVTQCPECYAEYQRQKYRERTADSVAYQELLRKNREYKALRKAEKAVSKMPTPPAPTAEDGAFTSMELREEHHMRKRKTTPYIQ